jgi:hypothetical protein
MLAAVAACAVASAGCAVHPSGGRLAGRESTVTDDVLAYLEREWPLEEEQGTVVATEQEPDSREVLALAEAPIGCADTVDGGQPVAACGLGRTGLRPGLLRGGFPLPAIPVPSWLGGASRPGTIPAGAGPPGRFFPAPVRPVFAPQSEPFFPEGVGPMGS